jgi:hypothetical protein
VLPRRIFIGDVHGCFGELQQLLEEVAYRPGSDRLRFVGDLVDRGPDSVGVVRLVRALCQRGEALCVVGNHEEKYVRFRRRLAQAHDDAGQVSMVFPDHKRAIFDQLGDDDHAWLASLPDYLLEEDLLLVHAGVCPRHHLTRADLDRRKYRDRLLRLRRVDGEGRMLGLDDPGEAEAHSWSADYDGRLGTVVYGHDPLDEPAVLPHSLGIDTGCCFGGRLTALIVDPTGERRFASVPARVAYAERRIDD